MRTVSGKRVFCCLFVFLPDELVTFDQAIKFLSDSAERALGVIAKFKTVRDIGNKTYTKLYDYGVFPMLDCAGEVWGFKEFTK